MAIAVGDALSQVAPLMRDELNLYFAWALNASGDMGPRNVRDQASLDEHIRNGTIVTVTSEDDKQFFFMTPEAKLKEIKCCFHPNGNHSLHKCLLGYVGNGIPTAAKKAILEESNSVRQLKGGVAANAFRTAATTDFLVGRLHEGLRNRPELKEWAMRSEAENLRAIEDAIIDGVKNMPIPVIPGYRATVHTCLVIKSAVLELARGGCTAHTMVSPVTGKLRSTQGGEPVEFDSVEETPGCLAGIFMYENRDGLVCPSGVPSIQSLLDGASLEDMSK
jgi:hypothetical protein